MSLKLSDKRTGFKKDKEYSVNSIEYRKSVLYLFFQWAYTNAHCHRNLIIEHRKTKLNQKAVLHKKANTGLSIAKIDKYRRICY